MFRTASSPEDGGVAWRAVLGLMATKCSSRRSAGSRLWAHRHPDNRLVYTFDLEKAGQAEAWHVGGA